MSSNTKARLLNDLESLRHQLAELEAYDANPELTPQNIEVLAALDADNIPLLGDAVLIDPASREEAISVRREALAHLDFALKELESGQQPSHSDTQLSQLADSQTTHLEPNNLESVIPEPASSEPVSSEMAISNTADPKKVNTDLQNSPFSSQKSTHTTTDDLLLKNNIFDDIDYFDDIDSTMDSLEFDEPAEEDPLSPPPNLSAHIQPESLILEIPKNPQTASDNKAALVWQNTQIDSVAISPDENSLNEKTSEPCFSNAHTLDAQLTTVEETPENQQIQELAQEHSTLEGLANKELAEEEPITEEPVLEAQYKAHQTSIEASLASAPQPTESGAPQMPHYANSPEVTGRDNSDLPAFLQAQNTITSTTKEENQSESASPQSNAEDNPFLPQYLRERLSKSKSSLLEEIARSSESLNASTALLRNFGGRAQSAFAKADSPSQKTHNVSTSPEHQAIVDHLVAKYLPIIEADLRQRLHASISQQVGIQQTNASGQFATATKPQTSYNPTRNKHLTPEAT